MQLIIIGIVALVLSAAAAAAWYARPLRRGRRVVINLDDESVWSGTVVRSGRRAVTLRRAEMGAGDTKQKADGRIVLPQRRIDVVQVLG